jgi:hypothetical protein
MIPELSGACYAVRLLEYISNIITLISVYLAYFHSVIKYGIILWGNSSSRGKMFTLQKKIAEFWQVLNQNCMYKSV